MRGIVGSTRSLVWGFVILFGLVACNYRREKLAEFSGPITSNWFQGIQLKILERQCMECHQPGNMKANVDLTTYVSVMRSGVITPFKPDESRLYISLMRPPPGRMPKDRAALPDADIQLIRRWIEVGAPEREATKPVETPNPPQPTYAWISANVFSKRCAGCHSAEDPKGGVEVTTYDTLMNSLGLDMVPIIPSKPEASGVCVTLRTEKMPKAENPPLPKLSRETIEAICEWIGQGAKNN